MFAFFLVIGVNWLSSHTNIEWNRISLANDWFLGWIWHKIAIFFTKVSLNCMDSLSISIFNLEIYWLFALIALRYPYKCEICEFISITPPIEVYNLDSHAFTPLFMHLLGMKKDAKTNKKTKLIKSSYESSNSLMIYSSPNCANIVASASIFFLLMFIQAHSSLHPHHIHKRHADKTGFSSTFSHFSSFFFICRCIQTICCTSRPAAPVRLACLSTFCSKFLFS